MGPGPVQVCMHFVFLCQSALKFSFSRILASLFEVMGLGCGSLLPALASLFTALFPQMPTCDGITAALLCCGVTGC